MANVSQEKNAYADLIHQAERDPDVHPSQFDPFEVTSRKRSRNNATEIREISLQNIIRGPTTHIGEIAIFGLHEPDEVPKQGHGTREIKWGVLIHGITSEEEFNRATNLAGDNGRDIRRVKFLELMTGSPELEPATLESTGYVEPLILRVNP